MKNRGVCSGFFMFFRKGFVTDVLACLCDDVQAYLLEFLDTELLRTLAENRILPVGV